MSSNQPDESAVPEPQYAKSIEFLERWLPGGPWVLTSMIPDKPKKGRATFTDTFGPNDVKSGRLLGWLEDQGTQGRRNIYWTPNACRKQTVKEKPKKVDIQGLYALHVDLDPRAGEDLAEERERIRKLLLDPSALGIPKPTTIVFSGGGYQAFWRLRVPFLIAEATEAAADDAGLWNRHLGDLLGGDATHNVDRVMRLPGSINRPDARKRDKGRTEALAAVVEFNDERHDLDGFEKAESVRSASLSPNGAAAAVTLEAGSDPSANLDRLPREVARLCRVAIAQGCDPEDPGRWTDGGEGSIPFGLKCGATWVGDRSAVVWHVVCALVRADVDDPTIRGFLLDPGWGISAHVLDQRDPEGYADRQIEKVREAEGRPVPRPTIYTNLGEVAEVVDQATDALVRAGVRIYQRGTELVRLVKHGAVSGEDDELRRAAESLVIYPASALWLVDQMSRAGKWRRKLKDDDGPSDPQPKHGLLLLSRAGSWPFPTLRGIVTAPTLRADGSVLQVPGYDAASGLIFAPGGTAFPPVPDRPTRAEAVAALALFGDLLAGFPFEDADARSVALSAILSGLVRASLGAIPLHAFDAPTAGTGKTLLAETAAIIVTGNEPASFSQGKEEGEDEKRIGAALRAGDACFLIDNCERAVGGDTLCSVISQRQVSIRILGRSEKVELPCDVLVMATGNGLQIHGDMARRTVKCLLDSKVERPERRAFGFDPRDLARERRAELVVAALTVMRARVLAEGAEPPSPVGSFGRWNQLVRAALLWTEAGDPARTMERLVEENEGGSELGAILVRWMDAFGDNELHAADLKNDEELMGLLVEATRRPAWSTKSVGWVLRKHRRKIVGGLTLNQVGEDKHGAIWRVTRTDGREPERGGEVAMKDEADHDVLG
ncbi:MAG: hypothetical protein GC161_15965 [Planctomycetaceae bacterium]|nr:hypothetical protein [Planctomycetaceae bacterium]